VVTAGEFEERRAFELQTHPALAGFVPRFEVTGSGSSAYVLFDHATTPMVTDAGIFAVDREGTTRFFLPAQSDLDLQVPMRPAAGAKLLDDGTLAFLQNARLHVLDELGNKLFELDSEEVDVPGFHHDVVHMPNGNWLILGHEFGRFPHPGTNDEVDVAGDSITEVTPDGEKVWAWSSFEHLDTSRAPGPPDDYHLVIENVHTGGLGFDWTHGNGIVYSEQDDSILFSMRHQDWVIKIDHGTGEIVWRLGHGGDFTLTSGTWFYRQHMPEWQPDGSLMLYDNAIGNDAVPEGEQRSRPVRYVLDESAMTATQAWDDVSEHYMSPIAGDVFRLDNGHVLVLDSALPLDPTVPFNFQIYARIREVDPENNDWVWTLRTDDNRFVYRCLSIDRLPGEAAGGR
jgi:hypothetical protein